MATGNVNAVVYRLTSGTIIFQTMIHLKCIEIKNMKKQYPD